MSRKFESGALFGHVYTLADRSCVRLRLARPSDFAAIRGLLAEAGIESPDLEAARLVQFDPRRRYVVCATGLIESSERLLGVGSITFGSRNPDFLVLAEPPLAELRGLLETLLGAAAEASPRAA